MAERKRATPMREEAYECLKKSILMGEYKPGEWLREEDISRKMGISRMPLREAFRKLEQDKFLEHVPNRGTRVTEVYTKDLGEIFDIRIYVESLISRNAATHITDEELKNLKRILDTFAAATEGEDIVRYAREFHEAIFAASRSEALVAIIEFVGSLITRIRHRNHLNPARRKDSLQEHMAIYEALTVKDPDLVEKATRHHLESSKAFSLVQLHGESGPKIRPRKAFRSVKTRTRPMRFKHVK